MGPFSWVEMNRRGAEEKGAADGLVSWARQDLMGTLCSTRELRLYSDSEAIITEGWGGRCYNPKSQVVQELYDKTSVSVGKKPDSE